MFAFVKKRKSDELGAPRKKPVKKKTPVKKRPSVLSQAQASALGATKRNTPNWLGNSTDDNNISEATNAAIGATAKNRATGGNGSRVVNVVGTAEDNVGTYTPYRASDSERSKWITDKLRRGGWDLLSSVEVVWNADINAYRFRVVARVLNQYGKDAIIQGVREAFIKSTVTNYVQGFGTYTLYKNVIAAIESETDQTVQPTKVEPTKNSYPGNNNSGGGNNSRNNTGGNNNSNNSPGILDALFGDSFSGGLGSALGLSTPVVILIAVIVGIIVLKK